MSEQKRSIGLTSIKLAAIESDGTIGTFTNALANTVEGSAKMITTEATTKEFTVEELDDPIESITTKKPAMELEWEMYDMTGAVLKEVMGGDHASDASNETYTPATTIVEVERSIEVTTKRNFVVSIVRAKLVATLDWNLGKEELAKVKVKAKVLAPNTATATAPWTSKRPIA